MKFNIKYTKSHMVLRNHNIVINIIISRNCRREVHFLSQLAFFIVLRTTRYAKSSNWQWKQNKNYKWGGVGLDFIAPVQHLRTVRTNNTTVVTKSSKSQSLFKTGDDVTRIPRKEELGLLVTLRCVMWEEFPLVLQQAH